MQTEFDVILKSSGNQKLNVIKLLITLTDLGLKEAKDLADDPPQIIKKNISKKDAEFLKAKLVEVGAEVEIK